MFRRVHNIKIRSFKPLVLLLTALMGTTQGVWAAGPPQPSSIENPVVLMLVIIMLILLLVIGLLSNVLLGAAGYLMEKEKKEKSATGVTAALVAGLLLFAAPAFAQDASAAAAEAVVVKGPYVEGLSNTAFYFIVSVIALEVIVIFFMLAQLRALMAKRKIEIAVPGEVAEVEVLKKKKTLANWWSKLNSFRPIEEEAQLDLQHEYDGIRELNNRLPPWWLYGFYLTIIFAGIYLWRYHVAYTAPLSTEEYQIAMREAEEKKAEYLKKSANNVDENTVKYLSEAPALEAGKKIFETSCAPCHGKNAEGVVGPNLTDDYWLHGGSLSEVFKSIKYGWPEKGMKSWKDDFSPVQIAQLTSFVKSLKGTNPPNAKEPQGTPEKEENVKQTADTTGKAVAIK